MTDKAKTFSLESIEHLEIFKRNPKLLKKLKYDIEQNSFYEIHQLYKTIHFRGMNSDLVDDCVELIFNGIAYFSTKDNIHCCYDLSKVFIETLKKAKIKSLNNDLREKIKFIHAALRYGNEERNEFSATILKWSTCLFENVNVKETDRDEINLLNCQKKFGHVDIHRELAMNLWSEKNYVLARYHFLHSKEGELFAKMMIECHVNYGFPSEYDLFLAQGVLQFLHLRNPPSANQFFASYVNNHPESAKYQLKYESSTFVNSKFPLINFIYFLLKTIKNGNLKTYQTLLNIYKPTLNKDPSLNSYLERIGLFYFNLKSNANNNANKGSMFSNLFKMLTSDMTSAPSANTSQQSYDEGDDDASDDDETHDDNFYENNYLD